MRISDEKRREVAATMMAISCRGVKDLTLGEVLNSILTGGAPRPTTEMAILARLADLIDRPAIKPEPSGRAYWRCPRCGAFNYRSAVTDCCGVIPAHYCANCGAEVVG